MLVFVWAKFHVKMLQVYSLRPCETCRWSILKHSSRNGAVLVACRPEFCASAVVQNDDSGCQEDFRGPLAGRR